MHHNRLNNQKNFFKVEDNESAGSLHVPNTKL